MDSLKDRDRDTGQDKDSQIHLTLQNLTKTVLTRAFSTLNTMAVAAIAAEDTRTKVQVLSVTITEEEEGGQVPAEGGDKDQVLPLTLSTL